MNARSTFALICALSCVACSEPVGVEEDAGPPEVQYTMPALIGPPAAAEDVNPDPHVVEVELTAMFADVDLGDGEIREMFTYNGVFPGPAIQAEVGDEVIIHFRNELWQNTTIHWHGLRISDQMDGSPRIQDPVAAEGGTFTYRFVVPEAGSFWYHPHIRAHEQIELGLYGSLVVHDREDPEYDAERIIDLDDILLDANGRVTPALQSHPEMVHGRSGNVLLTNGQMVPPSDVARPGQVERWRIVNTANARTMEVSVAGAEFRVIATDGGLLAEPFTTRRLELGVGQRYDIEVTYGSTGTVALQSHILALDENNEVVEQTVPVYTVEVSGEPVEPRVIEWPAVEPLAPREVDQEVTVEFDAVNDPELGLQWLINGVADREEPLYTFQQGDTIRMTLQNNAGPYHPFHLHGQFFEVVGKPGLYDTILVPGFESVEIIAHMDNPGQWMAHCHILEHAELGMMSEIVVEPTEAPAP